MDLRLTPDYRLLTLRDVEADAAEGMDAAVVAASAGVTGSTGYVLVISVAQDLIPEDVRLRVLGAGAPPGAPRHEHEIDFPSGRVRLGDTGVSGITGELAEGPGVYRIRVTATGRAEAADAAHRFLRDHPDLPTAQWGDALAAYAGLEHYLLELWRLGDSPQDDE